VFKERRLSSPLLTLRLIQHCIQWVPLGCEIDHLAPSGAEFRNIQLYTSTSQFVFMAFSFSFILYTHTHTYTQDYSTDCYSPTPANVDLLVRRPHILLLCMLRTVVNCRYMNQTSQFEISDTNEVRDSCTLLIHH
jgi:hypothetical protein